MTPLLPVRPAYAASATGVLLASVLVRPAMGQCRVSVEPPGASLSWRRASADAMRHIETLPTETRDCRDVIVEVRDRAR